MTRGYLSLRIDETNRAHHLYVNRGGRADGCWWVAYTLHFGGRKRRIRRSLGTKCLEAAIRLRDALFASIERDGEEVPERGQKVSPEWEMKMMGTGEAAERLAAAVTRHDSHAKGPTEMAGQKNGFDWANFGRFRHTWIFEADRLMRDCAEWTAAAVSQDDKSRRLRRRAAKLYERAADFYRRGSLGLVASVAWQKAADCYAALDMHEDAARCKKKADSIPVYWSDDQSTQVENRGGHP